MTSAAKLLSLKNVLNHPEHQRRLVYLYAISQRECTRNGKLTMEVGTHRENDLKAFLVHHVGRDKVHYDISNANTEDLCYDGENISIKHLSAPVGQGIIKAKWTSDTTKANEYIQRMIQTATSKDDELFFHHLIVFMEPTKERVTFVCVEKETIKKLVSIHGAKAFRFREGINIRGVEYSTLMLKNMMKECLFTVTINDAKFDEGMCPVAKRVKLLETMC